MRNLHELDKYRIMHPSGLTGDETCGMFTIFINGKAFNVVASSGLGWEHVSVSPKNMHRCPTWEEMCVVKNRFFHPEEVVMQLHPKESEYVNCHPYCLHLWRPVNGDAIPTPPKWMVG